MTWIKQDYKEHEFKTCRFFYTTFAFTWRRYWGVAVGYDLFRQHFSVRLGPFAVLLDFWLPKHERKFRKPNDQ